MNQDLKLIVYSYLDLEEVLIYLKNDIHTKDTIIKRYHKHLPLIIDASICGELETVKYLANRGIKPNEIVLQFGCFSGNLQLVKYFIKSGLRPDKSCLQNVIKSEYLYHRDRSDILKLTKYLIYLGIKPDKNPR